MVPDLKQALAALDAGRIEDARRLCQKLGKVPELAEATLFLEGLIANKRGRHAEAVKLLDPGGKNDAALGAAAQRPGRILRGSRF